MKTPSLLLSALLTASLFSLVPDIGAAEKETSKGIKATTGTNLSASDEKFIKNAAQGGMMEVKLGELAKTKASREDVKAFGAQMVTDHGQANEELKSLASAKGITLEEKLDAKHDAMFDKLSKLDGAAFDKAYIDDMVMDHKKDAAEFDAQAKNAKDADLKAFAVKTATVVHGHLEKIQAIQKAKQ